MSYFKNWCTLSGALVLVVSVGFGLTYRVVAQTNDTTPAAMAAALKERESKVSSGKGEVHITRTESSDPRYIDAQPAEMRAVLDNKSYVIKFRFNGHKFLEEETRDGVQVADCVKGYDGNRAVFYDKPGNYASVITAPALAGGTEILRRGQGTVEAASWLQLGHLYGRSHPGPALEYGYTPLSAKIGASGVTFEGSEDVDGIPCYRYNYHFKGSVQSWWIAASRGLVVLKCTMESAGATGASEKWTTTYTKLKEFAGGIWIPMEVHEKLIVTLATGEQLEVRHKTAIVTAFEINVGIENAEFVYSIPEGTETVVESEPVAAK